MAAHPSSRFALRLQGVVAVLLFVAVVGLLGYLAHSYDRRFDWTANGRNSLSEASRQVLEKLPEPVTVTAFVRANPELRARIDDLLQRYAAASPKFTVSYVNPDEAPARVKELGIRADGTVVLELAGRREKLEQLDEQALTSALMRLSRSGERKLIFLAGHGERSPDGQANHDLSSFTAALREQGVQATRPDPASGKDLPTDATLVITAPAVDLTADEVAAVQRFLAAGGNLLWLADPGPLHGLEPVAAELGLRFVPGTIIDPVGQAIAGSAHFAIATPENYRFHPALANFDFMTLYPLAAGIEHDEKAPWAATELVEIAGEGWSETGPIEAKVGFDEGNDRRGPFILASAFTRTQGEREQRVVVVGDGDFLSNAYVGNGGNLNLGLNLVNWLSADEGLVNIPPRTAADTDLALSRENSLLIGFGFLFLMPAAFAAAGLGVWLRRRGALMRGRLWLNLGLAIALAVLALVAWRQPGKAPPPAEIKLTMLDTQSVKRIEFHPPRGEGFALTRDGKAWFIEQPRLRAQPFRVETILELPAAKSVAQLALADNKDDGFGVDPPQARVTFDGTEIAFGLTNPVGLRRYVRVGDAVHLIDDRWFHHAASKWTDWVDRRLLPDGVTLTHVQLPDVTLARAGVNWQASPEKPGIGADAIAELVAEWQRAYAMDVEQAAAPADAKPLRLEWEGGALDLALARDRDEWLLYRRDAPILYRFSDNQGKRLLELKEPAPPAPGAAPIDPDATANPPDSGDDDASGN